MQPTHTCDHHVDAFVQSEEVKRQRMPKEGTSITFDKDKTTQKKRVTHETKRNRMTKKMAMTLDSIGILAMFVLIILVFV